MTANTLDYRADIDGLRGVAVLSVLLFHANLGVPGGYVGVDVFFVISGYLITSWILKTVANGTFTFREFWARRIRRILPASLAMNLSVLVVGYLLMFPKDFKELGESEIANHLFASNVYFWRTSGYFAGPAELKPLLHTWSLAIEEQYYLLFPPVLVALLKQSRQFAFGCLAFAALVSLLACGYFTQTMPSASFYLLPTRAWELLAGSLLAFSSSPVTQQALKRECISLLSLVTIVLCVFVFDASFSFPGFWAAIPVGCTVMLIHINEGQTTITRSYCRKLCS